jgi:hypothetical protein
MGRIYLDPNTYQAINVSNKKNNMTVVKKNSDMKLSGEHNIIIKSIVQYLYSLQSNKSNMNSDEVAKWTRDQRKLIELENNIVDMFETEYIPVVAVWEEKEFKYYLDIDYSEGEKKIPVDISKLDTTKKMYDIRDITEEKYKKAHTDGELEDINIFNFFMQVLENKLKEKADSYHLDEFIKLLEKRGYTLEDLKDSTNEQLLRILNDQAKEPIKKTYQGKVAIVEKERIDPSQKFIQESLQNKNRSMSIIRELRQNVKDKLEGISKKWGLASNYKISIKRTTIFAYYVVHLRYESSNNWNKYILNSQRNNKINSISSGVPGYIMKRIDISMKDPVKDYYRNLEEFVPLILKYYRENPRIIYQQAYEIININMELYYKFYPILRNIYSTKSLSNTLTRENTAATTFHERQYKNFQNLFSSLMDNLSNISMINNKSNIPPLTIFSLYTHAINNYHIVNSKKGISSTQIDFFEIFHVIMLYLNFLNMIGSSLTKLEIMKEIGQEELKTFQVQVKNRVKNDFKDTMVELLLTEPNPYNPLSISTKYSFDQLKRVVTFSGVYTAFKKKSSIRHKLE